MRKLIKIAAITVGLFVVALSYLSYKGWLDVKWIPIENSAKSTLIDITNQPIHAHSLLRCFPSCLFDVGCFSRNNAFSKRIRYSNAGQGRTSSRFNHKKR